MKPPITYDRLFSRINTTGCMFVVFYHLLVLSIVYYFLFEAFGLRAEQIGGTVLVFFCSSTAIKHLNRKVWESTQ